MLRKKESPEPMPPARPLAIVVADDVVEIQRLVAHWLGEIGHKVTCAGSGRELQQLIREQAFDLVITDIVMPDSDGHDAIAALIRTRPSTRIVAMSGGGKQMPGDAALRIAKSLGADAMLAKPFTKEQLFEAVQKATRR